MKKWNFCISSSDGSDTEDRFVSVCHVNPAFENPDAIVSAEGGEEHGDGVATGSTRSVASEDATIVPTNHPNGIESSSPPPSYHDVAEEKKPAVVVVRDANKSYTSGVPVLTNYNMTVEKGTM